MRTMFRGMCEEQDSTWFGSCFVDFSHALAEAKAKNKKAKVIAVRLPTWERT